MVCLARPRFCHSCYRKAEGQDARELTLLWQGSHSTGGKFPEWPPCDFLVGVAGAMLSYAKSPKGSLADCRTVVRQALRGAEALLFTILVPPGPTQEQMSPEKRVVQQDNPPCSRCAVLG
mmetsp:Transcript_24103/g.53423  ORF Transcript_24103/g.53423 Transcript_24103/m.53423 type:complete len:120 (+) Transcript_24103:926-1285(+)